MLSELLLLTAEQATTEATAVIAERPATVRESLLLVGEGWGAIFIVILVMMVFILVLNRVFRQKKKKP